MPKTPVIVYTDGGCKGSGLKGAWAYLLMYPSGNPSTIEGVGTDPATTNNIMELSAVLYALRKLEPWKDAIVTSDSQYVIKGINEWRHNWQKNGWRTADEKPVKNKDLWQLLLAEVDKRTGKTEYRWVKGHSGNEYNQRCDDMCTEAMKAMA